MSPDRMQLLQTSLTIAMCAAGALIVAIGTRQLRVRDVTRLPIISPRGKHVLGIFLILVGIVIFFSQFVGPKRPVRPAASPTALMQAVVDTVAPGPQARMRGIQQGILGRERRLP
jgi:hypothetical protein